MRVQAATCHYAADAARVLLARSRSYLQTASAPIFAVIDQRLPPPAVMATAVADVARCHCAPTVPARAYFRFDVNGASAGGPLTLVSAANDGAPVDTMRLRQALRRTLGMLASGTGVIAAAVTAGNDDWDPLRAVAVESAIFADGHVRAVYGYTLDPTDFVEQVIRPVFNGPSLFSWWQSDTNRRRNTDLAALAVFDGANQSLNRTRQVPTECYGLSAPDSAMANVLVFLDIAPATAAHWASNYTTSSQLPILAAFLAVTLGCGAAATIAARRESELASLRSDFVTSVSHELRMPLAQILLSGETLSRGRARTQSERDDAADAIVREAQRLTSLVDNVLHFSRVEHRNVHVAPERVDLTGFIDEIIADMAPLAANANVILRHTIPPGAEATLDPRAFRQVFYNLLDNAMKYGPRCQTITIGAQSVGTGVRLWVEDQGSGIPSGSESIVFQPFVRLERDRNRAVAGSGLGLAVVRELVRGHTGRIRVEPVPGGGARFVIDLPR
jgi:signal transduction histidine kinase